VSTLEGEGEMERVKEGEEGLYILNMYMKIEQVNLMKLS
jgi:hypothetical protein